MTNRKILFALLCLMISSGCANIDTVARTTSLPSDSSKDGVAIHLDAKQRLVLAKAFGTVCAEPSPDALSAFTASLGGSIANPKAEPDSLAAALQSTAASIGLRTQSITLMRDALYRICEAYYGRALTGPAVMTLLAQSQDLTAAILAIEQLTGPVVANQVILQGEALARSSAGIAQLQKLLDDARKEQQEKQIAFEQAREEFENTPEDKVKKQAFASAESDYNEATQLVSTLKANRDAAMEAPSAMVKGDGKLSDAAHITLPDTASRAKVAEAVKDIVESVLERSYVEEACIALIADNPPKRKHFECNDDTPTAQCTQEADYGDALTAWRVAQNFCTKTLERNYREQSGKNH